ncbi:MAG: sulfatase-like hydrolase/transferase [Planctomycetaceae bacterium]|nr:sulfatase-like hydrolase/transferase [Planctomycetaceae bacterium]
MRCFVAVLLATVVVAVTGIELSAAMPAVQPTGGQPRVQPTAARPNILWISCEDISSHLGCYGDPNATTPNLDKLADEGVRYTNAFTCHGVCAPSRTGIITGMYPIGLGANHMRSRAQLPDHVKCFPESLRAAGYYCTNNSKTDYNFNWKQSDVWDESSNKAHWKNRRNPDQPFFAVFNLTMTHESKIWPSGWEGVVKGLPESERHDPDSIKVPELYPDTPEVRAAHARLLDIITVMDKTAGGLLQELDEAGLRDDTIVIFWSDHGNGFARAKRWIYDTGTHVPMIARIPEKFRSGSQGTPGSVDSQLINLIDLGPTVLNLAGVSVPDNMFGRPFLGENLPSPRRYIYGARDRVDERVDLVRSVRDERYRYVRNLMPWRPALQHIEYSERSVVRQEMRRMLADGTLHRESAQFFDVPRPAEELYDLQNDPWEVRNLASSDDAEIQKTLVRLRAECDRWQLEVADAHLIPEAILDAEAEKAGSRWALLHDGNGPQRLQRLLDVAKTVGRQDPAEAAKLVTASADGDPAVRWWALNGLRQLSDSGSHADLFEKLTGDPDPAVRIVAAAALGKLGRVDDAVNVIQKELKGTSDFVRHAAMVELDELGVEAVRKALPAIREIPQNDYAGRLAAHALEMAGEN